MAEWEAPGQIANGIHYVFRKTENDDAETVIFVHGVGSYYAQFEVLATFLHSQGYNVLNYDLIGRGFSDPSPNGKYTEVEHIEQLHLLLEHVSLTKKLPLHFIGHSMGGALVTLFCNQYPQYCKTMTLLSPAGLMGFWPLTPLRNMRLLHRLVRSILLQRPNQISAWRQEFYYHTGTSLQREDELVASLALMYDHNPHASKALWKSILQFPMTDISPQIKTLCETATQLTGVHILWGKQDKVTLYSTMTKWETLFTTQLKQHNKANTCTVQTHSFDHAAHCFALEYPELVGQQILSFLQAQQQQQS